MKDGGLSKTTKRYTGKEKENRTSWASTEVELDFYLLTKILLGEGELIIIYIKEKKY